MVKKLLFGLSLFLLWIVGCSSGEASSFNNVDSSSTPATSQTSNEGYTVQFVNFDGYQFYVEYNVQEGQAVSPDGMPTRYDPCFKYTFKGWEPQIGPVYSDTTYVAQYDKERIAYSYRYDLNGGFALIPSEVGYALTLEEVEAPKASKDGYNFRGWSVNDEIVIGPRLEIVKHIDLEDDMVFKAIYSSKVKVFINDKQYFEDSSLSNLYSKEYEPYSNVDISLALKEGYVFSRWEDQNGTVVSYEKDFVLHVNEYDITLYPVVDPK